MPDLPVPDLIAAGAGPSATCSCTASAMSSPAGAVIVLRVAGEVDLSTVSIVRGGLDDGLARGPRYLIVDLAAMTLCDARGLSLLVRAGTSAAARGVGYAVAAAPAQAVRAWSFWPPGDLPMQFSSAGAAVLAAMAQHVGDARARISPERGPEWIRRWSSPPSRVQGAAREPVVALVPPIPQ